MMLFSIFISVAAIVGATTDNSMPADLLFDDFDISESSNWVASDDSSFLSSDPGDLIFDSSQNQGFDEFSYLASNDQGSPDPSNQLFGSNNPNSALGTSCNIEKRDDRGICSIDSAPQVHLEFPDLLEMGNTIIKEDSFLAPITIGIEKNSPGKCINLLHRVNLCCKGPLGTSVAGYYPLVVYDTVGKCRPGK